MKHFFVPHSVAFVKARAKEVAAARPELSWARALETTSAALGFASWFDARSRIESGTMKPSNFDCDVDRETVLWRRHRQGCALIDVGGFAPSEADYFCRLWHPTSRDCTFHHSEYASAFMRCALGVTRADVEPTKIHKDLYEDDDYYVLNDAARASAPAYFTGNHSSWLSWENGLWIKIIYPDLLPEVTMAEAQKWMREQEPRLMEWYLGIDGTTPFDNRPLRVILEAASAHPHQMFPLAFRSRYDAAENQFSEELILPAITGHSLAKMLCAQGALRFQDVVWYEASHADFERVLSKRGIDAIGLSGPVPLSEAEISECAREIRPNWLSPFKSGPMAADEYHRFTESGSMQVHDELAPDFPDDGDDDSDDPPSHPPQAPMPESKRTCRRSGLAMLR